MTGETVSVGFNDGADVGFLVDGADVGDKVGLVVGLDEGVIVRTDGVILLGDGVFFIG